MQKLSDILDALAVEPHRPISIDGVHAAIVDDWLDTPRESGSPEVSLVRHTLTLLFSSRGRNLLCAFINAHVAVQGQIFGVECESTHFPGARGAKPGSLHEFCLPEEVIADLIESVHRYADGGPGDVA
jgi:hypothetical protein